MTPEEIKEELKKINKRTKGDPIRGLEEIMKLLEKLKEEENETD